ncbi:MAG: hypothetical protein JSS07_00455 [Proteobacteria bacterium]|nr:hypothetical protein [Pseudomonadota bacterium]
MIKFVFAIVLLCFAVVLLSYTTFTLGHHYAFSGLLFSQCINMLGCYLLLGIGIGLPIVILATILGWIQLVLLLSGNINPHLAKEGFFHVLNTLFSKL